MNKIRIPSDKTKIEFFKTDYNNIAILVYLDEKNYNGIIKTFKSSKLDVKVDVYGPNAWAFYLNKKHHIENNYNDHTYSKRYSLDSYTFKRYCDFACNKFEADSEIKVDLLIEMLEKSSVAYRDLLTRSVDNYLFFNNVY